MPPEAHSHGTESLRILHVAAEVAPFAKAGGLADVVQGLSDELAARGHDARVLLPDYRQVRPGTLALRPVGRPHSVDVAGRTIDYRFAQLVNAAPRTPRIYFLDCPAFFGEGGIYGGDNELGRFLLLCRAALSLCHELDWAPQVLHCHDWHTSLLPLLLADDIRRDALLAQTRTALTLHNIGYQGLIPAADLPAAGADDLLTGLPLEADGETVNILRAGIRRADVLTTVSPTHAQEIMTDEYGMGMQDDLRARPDPPVGILNGADYREWQPATDPFLAAAYDAADLSGKQACRAALRQALGIEADASAPVIGMVTRLVEQKGIDLVLAALPDLLAQTPLSLALLGDGEARFVAGLKALAAAHPGRLGFAFGYDNALAHRIIAGSDLFLIPSRYEPCGLTQMYAMRYGSVPVVRRTGGLADTVTHFDPATGQGTGSVFEDADPGGVRWALETALQWYASPAAWSRVQANGLAADFSWPRQAQRYVELYAELVQGLS